MKITRIYKGRGKKREHLKMAYCLIFKHIKVRLLDNRIIKNVLNQGVQINYLFSVW